MVDRTNYVIFYFSCLAGLPVECQTPQSDCAGYFFDTQSKMCRPVSAMSNGFLRVTLVDASKPTLFATASAVSSYSYCFESEFHGPWWWQYLGAVLLAPPQFSFFFKLNFFLKHMTYLLCSISQIQLTMHCWHLSDLSQILAICDDKLFSSSCS